MNYLFAKKISRIAIGSILLTMASSAFAQNVRRITTFATGTAVNATGPDSIALSRNSLWVSYTNGADSTGLSGSSTIVQYKLNGGVRHTYSISGSVDGLKVDPRIQLLQNGSDPLVVTPIVFRGTNGTNLATGQPNQPTSQNDPDSLKLTPTGDLMLSSGDDGQLLFVGQPGTPNQSVSFLTLLDPNTGLAVSGLDDAVFATARRGTFYLADTGNNRVLKIEVDHVPVGSLFASISSLNELAVVDIHTGLTTPLVSNLNGPHGLEFVPHTDDDDDQNDNK